MRPYETNEEPRFYLTEIPEESNLDGWTAIVDEERGGVIAYFGDEEQATAFAQLMNSFPLIREGDHCPTCRIEDHDCCPTPLVKDCPCCRDTAQREEEA